MKNGRFNMENKKVIFPRSAAERENEKIFLLFDSLPFSSLSDFYVLCGEIIPFSGVQSSRSVGS
jgi:hypothetical protein